MPRLDDFDEGLFVGVLVGEGHFGGDGRQPQVTLRMHTRHEALFEWIMARFPRTKLYGPYEHADRTFFQWMARGRALVLDVLPVLDETGFSTLDDHAAERLERMRERYADYIARVQRLG